MNSDGWEDDEKTVLSWLDPPEEDDKTVTAVAPKDDDKTVFGEALPPVAPPARAPSSDASESAPPLDWFAASETPFSPPQEWSPETRVTQALLGHGLASALSRAARRAPDGMTAAQVSELLRDMTRGLRHPTDAILEDEVLTQFRDAVAASTQDLSDAPAADPICPPDLDAMEQQEWQALGKGLFVLLRELERRAGDKPRIGRNARLHDQLVRLGQDPFTGPPPSDLARYDPAARVPMIRAQFMGFFGPFGAFPLAWTEEVQHWFRQGDKSFVAFVDIFTARFQELFFRAWSDAHAITQFDHPSDDRFETYLLALTGTGTPAMRNRDAVPDTVKAHYTGLAGGRVKSPTRLRQILQLHFRDKLTVEVEELVPTWLDFEPDTLSQLGRQGCGIGMDMHLGRRVRTVGDKLRLHLRVSAIDDYFALLPSGDDHAHLRDLVFWYLGEAYEIDVVLWLPQSEIQPTQIGVNAQLGWMACVAPPKGDPAMMVQVAAYALHPEKQQEAAA